MKPNNTLKSFEDNNKIELIDNEKEISWKIDWLEENSESSIERKESLLILNKIEKYVESDIDLVLNKERNQYLFISWDNTLSEWLDIKQLKIIDKILEAYYNESNNLNSKENIFKIETTTIDLSVEWRITDKWKKLDYRWNRKENWKIEMDQIIVTNSNDRKWYIPNFIEDNLSVLTELWDENLRPYVKFLNKFIKIDSK